MHILTTPGELVRPQQADWQVELRQAVRDGRELCRRLGLPSERAGPAGQFPVFVPPSFLARMRCGDADDPLLRQVLPGAEETVEVPGFSADPVGDAAAAWQAGVLQKYAGRVLLVTTGACAVHCRYCFRRHFPYQELPRGDAAWEDALATIAADTSISEVILSGGDPLMLVDQRLRWLLERIAAVPHVARLRVHTRLPIVIPTRVTEELLAAFSALRLPTTVVLHANHAQELNDQVARSVDCLRGAGVLLLNQAVLLRGVNDSVVAQQTLSERLLAVGVLPYYLHQLDRVTGAAHFEVPVVEGKQIVAALRERLPGYLVPTYVQEVPGEPSKTVL